MKKKTVPFRAWLGEQKLTVEGFVAKAREEGLSVRVGTAFKWARGVMPRATARENLSSHFSSIRF